MVFSRNKQKLHFYFHEYIFSLITFFSFNLFLTRLGAYFVLVGRTMCFSASHIVSKKKLCKNVFFFFNFIVSNLKINHLINWTKYGDIILK